MVFAFYALSLPATIPLLSKFGTTGLSAAFTTLILLISFLVGASFPLAAKLHYNNTPQTASHLYNKDMVGSAIGAILTSALLIPLVGIINVCYFISILKIISTTILFTTRKNYKDI